MKANYNNWVPKWLVVASGILASIFLVLFFILSRSDTVIFGNWSRLIVILCFLLFIGCLGVCVWFIYARSQFSYEGKRKLAKEVIDYIANQLDLEEDDLVLDIGCGSGALAIAVAKRHPQAKVIGMDRWGKEYTSFSKTLCQRNAKIEGVSNVDFIKGDANCLDFPDETFDAVCSNYVYHNIRGKNRQELLLETLRVLKKGGTFAIHDIFSKEKYGDMDSFLEKLKEQGYSQVSFIDTTQGVPMTSKESKRLLLTSSKLLYGVK